MTDPDDLDPVSKVEFAQEITPALALVAPVGMSGDERKTWMAAAYKALDGIPIRLLKVGVAMAMRSPKVDHPSKIVPTIMAEIKPLWDSRKRRAPPPPDPKPVRAINPPVETIPLAEVKAMTPALRQMGLAVGWITQEQFDAAQPQEDPAPAGPATKE